MSDNPMQSEPIDKLAAALAKAQSEFKPIKKDKTAKVRSEKGSYEYHYADLSAVFDSVREALAKNGLAVTQRTIVNGGLTLETRLLHSAGQWIAATYPLPSGGRAQEMGSALTYAKRYSLSSMLGIAAEDDDDGADAAETKPRPPAARDPSPPPEPPKDAPKSSFQLMAPNGRVASRHERPSKFLEALETEMREAADPHIWWAINGAQAKAIAEQFPQAMAKVTELEEIATYGREAAA